MGRCPYPRQEPFCKRVLGTPKTLENGLRYPTAPARTPHNKNTVNTSLVQALLGIDGVFIA